MDGDEAGEDLRGHLVVDGANVVGSRPDGWWRDRAGAATRLARGLEAWASAYGADLRVTLVVEGKARALDVGVAPSVEVVSAPGSGDDTLVEVVRRLVAAETGSVVAVTSDRGLAARVRAAGGDVRGASWLRDALDHAERR